MRKEAYIYLRSKKVAEALCTSEAEPPCDFEDHTLWFPCNGEVDKRHLTWVKPKIAGIFSLKQLCHHSIPTSETRQ